MGWGLYLAYCCSGIGSCVQLKCMLKEKESLDWVGKAICTLRRISICRLQSRTLTSSLAAHCGSQGKGNLLVYGFSVKQLPSLGHI